LHTSIYSLPTAVFKNYKTHFNFFYQYYFSCSSADEDGEDPSTKAHREKERRQANNVRER
jgi:hypothetical protein